MEDEAYASRLSLMVRNYSKVTDAAPMSHRLELVAFPRPFDSIYLLTNFEYCWKESKFEQQFHVRHHVALLVSWRRDIFFIWTRELEKFFTRM